MKCYSLSSEKHFYKKRQTCRPGDSAKFLTPPPDAGFRVSTIFQSFHTVSSSPILYYIVPLRPTIMAPMTYPVTGGGGGGGNGHFGPLIVLGGGDASVRRGRRKMIYRPYLSSIPSLPPPLSPLPTYENRPTMIARQLFRQR